MKWMTAEQAAEYLHVAPRTVLAWARTGRLKGHVLSGTKRIVWRFLVEDLDNLLEKTRDRRGNASQEWWGKRKSR